MTHLSITIPQLTTYEQKKYTGYDIGIFQRWNIKEHGPADLNITSPLYKLMKKQLLVHSSHKEESSYDSINGFKWHDIDSWNKLRQSSSFIKNNPECLNNMYDLQIGFIYKFIINDTCICVDCTKHIITLQRHIREKYKNRTACNTNLKY
jgi:hypothetical protein